LAVKPFYQLKLAGLLNGTTKTQFKVHWTPFFSFLEANVAFKLPTGRNRRQVTDAEINRIYEQCLSLLKEKLSYCFASRQTNPTKWKLGTWPLKTRHSTILKKGTEAEKAKVATTTNQNRMRRALTRPGRQRAVDPLCPYRQRQRVDGLICNTTPQEETKTQDGHDNHHEAATTAI
jgi:hypothetical protein